MAPIVTCVITEDDVRPGRIVPGSTWPNGATAHVRSAEDPEGIRSLGAAAGLDR